MWAVQMGCCEESSLGVPADTFFCRGRLLLRLRSEGAQGASGKPPASSGEKQLCCMKNPSVGSNAPTTARIGTCHPTGRSHFSFGGERKVCKRKPAARRLQRRPAPLRVAGFGLREPLRGCPRPRGVRRRRSPCRSLCSPPTLPAGRFGLRPRPHWGHASLRDSSLRSPAGKKPLIAHFAGGTRNVAHNGVG